MPADQLTNATSRDPSPGPERPPRLRGMATLYIEFADWSTAEQAAVRHSALLSKPRPTAIP